MLCSKVSFISWWFKVFEDLCSLHNFKHEIPSETHLIPFAEANEQKSGVERRGSYRGRYKKFCTLESGHICYNHIYVHSGDIFQSNSEVNKAALVRDVISTD